MALFVAVNEYGGDAERRQRVRPTHREYLQRLLDEGKIHESGPFTDDSGSIVIYNVESLADAQELLANDPFTREGVITNSNLREWTVVFAADT